MYEVTIDWDGENQESEVFDTLYKAQAWIDSKIRPNTEFTYFTVQVIA